MATSIPAAHPLSIDGSIMTEQDWNAEAADMIEQVITTQQEVSELLTTHMSATSELQALKESCTRQLQELQTDAWKLQLYAELERMSSQLEQLTPLAEEPCEPHKHKESSGATDSAAMVAAQTASEGPQSNADPALSAIDEEIAALDKQLAAAKREMQSMMQMKLDLEKELQQSEPPTAAEATQ